MAGRRRPSLPCAKVLEDQARPCRAASRGGAKTGAGEGSSRRRSHRSARLRAARRRFRGQHARLDTFDVYEGGQRFGVAVDARPRAPRARRRSARVGRNRRRDRARAHPQGRGARTRAIHGDGASRCVCIRILSSRGRYAWRRPPMRVAWRCLLQKAVAGACAIDRLAHARQLRGVALRRGFAAQPPQRKPPRRSAPRHAAREWRSSRGASRSACRKGATSAPAQQVADERQAPKRYSLPACAAWITWS